MQGLYGFSLNWTFPDFLDFHVKNPCKKKKVHINCFDEQEKPLTYLKIFRKKYIPLANNGGSFSRTWPSQLF